MRFLPGPFENHPDRPCGSLAVDPIRASSCAGEVLALNALSNFWPHNPTRRAIRAIRR